MVPLIIIVVVLVVLVVVLVGIYNGLVTKRNVLKRFERVEILKKRGQWKEGDRVQGLRKTKPGI